MAKKILYKVTAYHCPRCGGVTEPTKKYCDYCSRDLAIRYKSQNKTRLLIDCGNYVFFNELASVQFSQRQEISAIERDMYGRVGFIRERNAYHHFIVDILHTSRGNELLNLDFTGIKNIRIENLERDIGYEAKCYIAEIERTALYGEIGFQRINFVGISEPQIGNAIPTEIIENMRCKNCGAPIKSRYCACDYCGGWQEVEW